MVLDATGRAVVAVVDGEVVAAVCLVVGAVEPTVAGGTVADEAGDDAGRVVDDRVLGVEVGWAPGDGGLDGTVGSVSAGTGAMTTLLDEGASPNLGG